MSTYLIFFVLYMMKRSLRSLFSAKTLAGIFVSYVLFMLSISAIFSLGYSAVENLDKGYLTYGRCCDTFTPSMLSDEYRSKDHFYFTAVTLFTIGYGDICPMGWSKYLVIFNGFIGNFITVVVMVIVISTYLKRQ